MIKIRSLIFCTALLLFVIGLSHSVKAANNGGFSWQQNIDSLPAKTNEYLGLRLHLYDVQLNSKSEDWIKIGYTPINTGREDLRFGEVHLPHLKNLVVEFDESFNNSNLVLFQDHIEENLLYEDLTVLVGQIQRRKEMKIKVNGMANALAATPTVDELKEKGAAVAKEEKKKKKKKDEDTFSINVGSSDDEPIVVFDKNTCPDLRIENIKILKQSKNSVTLEYTLLNDGKGPAQIIGTKKGTQDDVAFKAHISSSKNLNRGAAVIGGGFVKGFPKDKNGMLLPQESHIGTIKLDLYKMTRFTPVIILELDTYQSVRECNELNNRNHIKLDRK